MQPNKRRFTWQPAANKPTAPSPPPSQSLERPTAPADLSLSSKVTTLLQQHQRRTHVAGTSSAAARPPPKAFAPAKLPVTAARSAPFKRGGSGAAAAAGLDLQLSFPQDLSTYVGPRGYTVPKEGLDDAQIAELRRVLTVRPVTGGAAFGAVDAVEYPIYREAPTKLFLPRFFGERAFGPAKRLAIPHGDDIALHFHGSLRPIQTPVVAAYMAAVSGPHGGGGLLELPCAFGKTVLSLNIIAQVAKKTLVIVNKEFLLNQWIERIGQFLPTARVGRIQGPEIDVDGKDIVLGMLQSISMKDYDARVFQSFGLTIIDEVHHISSEVFSRALFKIVSKYMLGLSATMDRKDGTTYVFKQFLGDVVFKGDREEGHHVEVRAIQYLSQCPVFNLVETDFRGNPKYSTMIVKLCEHTDRSDFIVRVVRDLLGEQPRAQIMVLAHNRSLLSYLHDAIERAGFATVGYYVGGMKEAALKASESKQVVLATYAMAAEALDIKTLSTLVMVTPKTDIVQSVGRILREKHDKPLVVDIVDKHDVFQNQWAKRRRYYKKCGYTIKQVNSDVYAGFDPEHMARHWRVVYAAATGGKRSAASAACGDTGPDNDSGIEDDVDDDDEVGGDLDLCGADEEPPEAKARRRAAAQTKKCYVQMDESMDDDAEEKDK